MIFFHVKTHQSGRSYAQPHFFILNKGINSGKPLREPCPNCFVCTASSESDSNFMYWLVFGLWKSHSFHPFLKGSVIPFITIGDTRNKLRATTENALQQKDKFLKTIKALDALDAHEKHIKQTLSLIQVARVSVFKNWQ